MKIIVNIRTLKHGELFKFLDGNLVYRKMHNYSSGSYYHKVNNKKEEFFADGNIKVKRVLQFNSYKSSIAK